MYREDHQGKHHLVATDKMKFCLDASPKKKLTSKEFKRGTFSPCRWDANQVCCTPYFMYKSSMWSFFFSLVIESCV